MPSTEMDPKGTASEPNQASPQEKHQDFMWIALGDIHDDISRLDAIAELAEADGVIVTGDMTFGGGVKQAEKVIFALQERNPKVWAQIGNMDREEVTHWLQENDWNLHTEVRALTSEVCVFGVGASTFTPFGTPSEYPESHFAQWLEQAWVKARKWKKQILISHNPPKDTLCDIIGDGVHVGSTAVREFIMENQPDICICGHIHEACNMDRLGRTIIINPGNFAAGGYVILRSHGGELSAELKHLEG